jgi:hypothetical protein
MINPVDFLPSMAVRSIVKTVSEPDYLKNIKNIIAEALTTTANRGNTPAKDTAKMTEGKP